MNFTAFPGGLPPFLPRVSSDFDPLYEDLLSRAKACHDSACDLSYQSSLPAVCPRLQRYTNHMVIWREFTEFVLEIARPVSHVTAFLTSDCGISLRIDREGLILPKTVSSKRLKATLEDYIEEYVLCKGCRGWRTLLDRNVELRRYVMTCRDCLLVRSVEVLLKGGHQGAKAERRLA